MANQYGEKVFGERTYAIEGTLPTTGQYCDAGTDQNEAALASTTVNAAGGRGICTEQASQSTHKALAKLGIVPYVKPATEAHVIGDPLTRSQTTAGTLRKALPGEPLIGVADKAADATAVKGAAELIPGGGVITLPRQVRFVDTGLVANAEIEDAEVPAGYRLDALILRNTTANAVTINIGTTGGDDDVVAAGVVPASGVLDCTLLLHTFSFSAAQALFISSSSWSSANLTAYAVMTRLV